MIKGNGPCNAERMANRRGAHEDGAWVREAADAYADKQAASYGGCGMSDAQATGRCGRSSSRSRRGLSHVHVGSLHAPDAEMALRNARDLYTRRQEGVSLWVVAAADIAASSPDEKRRVLRPGRPTRSTGTRRSTTSPKGWSTCERPPLVRLRRSASADDALVSAQRMGGVDQPRPAARGGRRARPTSRSTCSARPASLLTYAGALEDAGAHRGRPRLPPRRARLPQRAARRAAETATSASRWPGCWCSRRTSCELYAALAGLAPTRRSPAVAGQGGQGGRLPPRPRHPVGAAARRRHRRVARAGCRPALDAEWPYVDELFDAAYVDPRLVADGVAVDPATLRDRRSTATSTTVLDRGDAEPCPTVAPGTGGGRRGVHTEHLGYLLAEMQHLHRSHPGATW